MPQDLYEDEEDLKFFLEETEEHIRSLKEGAKALDGGGAISDTLLESLYRSAHTIKGSSATFGYPPLVELAQAMEKFLDRARKKTMPLQEDGIALLKEGASGLETLKDALEGRKSPPDHGELAKRFDGFTGAAPKKEKAPSPKSRSVGEAIVLPQDKRLRAILQEGFKRGFRAFQIDLSISPQSPMPFVRAVQATKELERSGRIAHLDPPLQMGKADEFGGSLRMFFVTKLEESEILELADSIYDVENVKIVEIFSEVKTEKPAPREERDGKREKPDGKGEIFELHLQVSQKSATPSLRCLQALKQLSSLGTVISSDPEERSLEENEAVFEMQVLLQSEHPLSDLKTKLSRMAETQVTFKEKEEPPQPVQIPVLSPHLTSPLRGEAGGGTGPSHLPSPWALGAAGEVFLLLSRKIAQLTQQEEQLEKLKENLRTRYPADHLVTDLTETARGIDHTVREMKGQIMAAYLGALKEKLQEVPLQVSALMEKMLAEVEAVSDMNMETFEAELDRLIGVLTDLRQDLRMLRS